MPNYQNYSSNYSYQPMQQYNPYLQRMENLQQFQQTLNPMPMQIQNQFPALGKIVESVDIVKVTDIPMDGNMYYFPKADGTEIYGKQFGMDGKTRILTFKPLLEDNPSNSPSEQEKINFGAINDVLGAIQEDLKALTDKVDRISKPEKAKKGGSDE